MFVVVSSSSSSSFTTVSFDDLCVGFSSSKKKALETFLSSASPYEDDDADFEDKDASLSHNPSSSSSSSSSSCNADETFNPASFIRKDDSSFFSPSMMSLTFSFFE